MAGQTLHSGLELPLEQSHNDGLVPHLVFVPGQVGCCLIIKMVVFLFLVPLSIVRLTPETRTQRNGPQEQLQPHLSAKPNDPTEAKELIQNILIMNVNENYRLHF